MGFFERNTSVFPATIGIAPAEMGVVVVGGQVVLPGFYPFVFACSGICAVVHLAGVPYCFFALVVGFFVADEMFGTDEADVETLFIAFGARVLFVGGADNEPGGPAGSLGFFAVAASAGLG